MVFGGTPEEDKDRLHTESTFVSSKLVDTKVQGDTSLLYLKRIAEVFRWEVETLNDTVLNAAEVFNNLFPDPLVPENFWLKREKVSSGEGRTTCLKTRQFLF